ncbi:MAG TPA: radical SAM protein [Candidatus Hydrogenedentes bacterium]|nr:radical SAM protein [Candidatus Hydrogenedentota bacterium]
MYPRTTKGYCVSCGVVRPAEVVEESGALVFRMQCPHCREVSSIVEHDAGLYRQWEATRRPNRPPESRQTPEQRGCPFDCGLCPNHRQKSCISLIEVTTACDLGCPVCFANAGGNSHRPLQEIEQMLDACVQSANGKPDIIQISGGEPACHPQLVEILRAVKAHPFKYLMLNTNGLAIAEGRLSCAELKSLGHGFDIHLQFDGLDNATCETLRGRAVLEQKLHALDLMAEHEIPVTLVATLRNGVNVPQLGDLLRFALTHPAVRGLNLQCEAHFGRNTAECAAREPVTQTQVVREIERQAPELLNAGDFLPLSCGLASLAYLEKVEDSWKPISPALAELIQGNPMTISIEEVKTMAAEMCACRGAALLQEIAGRLPDDLFNRSVANRSRIVQERFFHVTIISFLDARNFDLDRACRECTHIVQPDGRKIPFSTFNTIYREQNRVSMV